MAEPAETEPAGAAAGASPAGDGAPEIPPAPSPSGAADDGEVAILEATEEPPLAAPPDEDAALSVEQISEEPPDARCEAEPPALVLTGRVPAAIDPSAPRRSPTPAPPSTSRGIVLDPRSAADLPATPPRPRRGRSLPPNAVALFGALFGVVTIASVVALAIQLDHPSKGLAPAASSVSALAPPPRPTVAVPAAAAPSPLPAPGDDHEAPPEPGPWRVGALAHEEGIKLIQGKLGLRSLMTALEEEKVPRAEIFRILKSFDDPKLFDKPKKSHAYAVALDRGSKKVKGFEYTASVVDVWQSRENDEGRLVGTKLDMKVEERRVAKAILVKDDLKSAAVEAGFDDDILDALDDALEDRMAIARLGAGTTLRIVAREQRVFGKFARYLDVEALEVATPKSEKPTRIYHFRQGKHAGYFDDHGKAPYKGGWRSPLKFPRITSRFNPKRLHPVLHVVAPHNGVDFGAPLGTPVYAASFGTVEHVGPHGASGNLVLVEHAGGIQTGYAHLSRFAPGLKKGDKVETRQLVGFVGSTGRSTGPHLHFSVKKNGQFVDPLTALKMDGERILPKGEREAFDALRAELDKLLDALPLPDRPSDLAAPPEPSEDEPQHEEGEEGDYPAPSGGAPAPAAPTEPAREVPDDTTPESAVWKPY